MSECHLYNQHIKDETIVNLHRLLISTVWQRKMNSENQESCLFLNNFKNSFDIKISNVEWKV